MEFSKIKAEVTRLYNTTFILHSVAITALLFTCGMLFPSQHWLMYLCFLIGFSVFDVIGFTNAVYNTVAGYQDGKEIQYRIIQVMMQISLLANVFLLSNWKVTLCCIGAWWFTACDKLFYKILRAQDEGYYHWLESWWSVFFLLKRIGIKPYESEFGFVSAVGASLFFILSLIF